LRSRRWSTRSRARPFTSASRSARPAWSWTFVALRILEVCVAELIDPSLAFGELVENGSLQRSVELATTLLERDAA
jgi:hypothetical protein